MKLCMSHYIHKSIPDAKFQTDSLSNFRDMTSQNFLQENRQVFSGMKIVPERICLHHAILIFLKAKELIQKWFCWIIKYEWSSLRLGLGTCISFTDYFAIFRNLLVFLYEAFKASLIVNQ